MNLARICRQTVEWAAATGQGSRGDRTYAAPQAVPARSVPYMRDLIGKNGEVVTTTNNVTLLFQPTIGDLLDGNEVVSVKGLTDYTGRTVGYQVLTR